MNCSRVRLAYPRNAMSQRKTQSRSRPETGELSIIRSLRSRPQALSRAIRLAIGDDCALISPPAGHQVAVTTDLSIEDVHFRRGWPAEAVGHRCLARGLSDLAAMGAKPIACFLSMAIPAELTTIGRRKRSWLDRFLEGFLALAGTHGAPLIGGDTAQSRARPQALALFDVVLLGTLKRNQALRRSRARSGDLIYVTGALGGAAAELLALDKDPQSFQSLSAASPGHPQLYPEPRVQVGLRLLSLATAAIDLSDGLATDLRHLCEESGLAADLYDLPIHTLASCAEVKGLTLSALNLALYGGEDYELLFTAAPTSQVPRRIAGVPVSLIGKMKPRRGGSPVLRLRAGGKLISIDHGGWEHFRGSP